MIGSTNSKGAWIVIPLLCAAILALFNSISQGVLWEIPNSRANLKTSGAQEVAADAQQKDAANKLQAAIETARALIESARTQGNAIVEAAQATARGQIIAAQEQARGLRESAQATVYAETAGYTQLTKPFIGDPAEKIAGLNDRIAQLKRQSAQPGIIPYNNTAEIARLEEEKAILKETASMNFADTSDILLGGMNSLVGGVDRLYANSSKTTPPRRMVELEK